MHKFFAQPVKTVTGFAAVALAASAVITAGAASADVVNGVPPEFQATAQQVQQQAVGLNASLPPAQQDQVRVAVQGLPAPLNQVLPPAFTNDLDGWIRNALYVLNQHGIPGSYDGIFRNIQRESGGNPQAINLYDSNAAAGIPSKGLLQVIDPTFQAYHVDGTSWDIYDPVANITAACNYAAHRYGSIDNVFSAY
ncbi:transglycosylase SLT domain-containing protein [Nocardia tengchongensis]|uniref:Transglycosylase SLT domain-containing protein n=1 Tax=Nocardia tengchongensis TaxID=2055889 RepID=A0ABX8CTD6_9NOCA|nr:transglycosylase SLT domain-containing protein [Nocardia tengchongensis]QVI23171.1 transglycosylase SLT domain-containing protein [Nocardia tengchongensis]